MVKAESGNATKSTTARNLKADKNAKLDVRLTKY
jgi:hypothetical protein